MRTGWSASDARCPPPVDPCAPIEVFGEEQGATAPPLAAIPDVVHNGALQGRFLWSVIDIVEVVSAQNEELGSRTVAAAGRAEVELHLKPTDVGILG